MTDSTAISQALLDSLWDFSDPTASAARFRAAADDDSRDAGARAELCTQLARALGLLGQFTEADAILDAALTGVDDPSGVLQARVALERGRLRASAERLEDAVPLFTRAARKAAAAGSKFLALDALHMLALSDTGHEEEWAAEGLAVLDTVSDPRTRRWGVALNNNLAWHLHDSDRPAEALVHFERALVAADAFGTADQRFLGQWGLARCLRTLGRTVEALAIQRHLATVRPDDEFVVAELALLT